MYFPLTCQVANFFPALFSLLHYILLFFNIIANSYRLPLSTGSISSKILKFSYSWFYKHKIHFCLYACPFSQVFLMLKMLCTVLCFSVYKAQTLSQIIILFHMYNIPHCTVYSIVFFVNWINLESDSIRSFINGYLTGSSCFMFNHILPYRKEFQISVKSGTTEGYFWETDLDFIHSKVNSPSEQRLYSHSIQNRVRGCCMHDEINKPP